MGSPKQFVDDFYPLWDPPGILEDMTSPDFKPLELFLSRNPMAAYSGTYTLSSYHPQNYTWGLPCWCYHAVKEGSFSFQQPRDIVQAILDKVGIPELQPGSCLNLLTGEVTYLVEPSGDDEDPEGYQPYVDPDRERFGAD